MSVPVGEVDPFADLQRSVARRDALEDQRVADEGFREAQASRKLDMFSRSVR